MISRILLLSVDFKIISIIFKEKNCMFTNNMLKINIVMSNKSKNIKLNEKKIIEEKASRDIFMAELGNLLISNNISFPDDEETVRQVNELKRDIKKIKSEQDKISQYRKRIDSIVADEKNALRKIKENKRG